MTVASPRLQPGLETATPVGSVASQAEVTAIRVLHVVPSLHGGGMEHALLRLLQQAGGPEPADGTSIQHAVCILRDGEPALVQRCRDHAQVWELATGGSALARRSSWLRLRRLVRSFSPQVVHARTTAAWFDAAAATFGQPTELLLSFHGRTDLTPLTRIRRSVLRWAVRRARAVLTVSRDAAATLADTIGIRGAGICTIPNGVDTERFHPPAPGEQDTRRQVRRQLGLQDKHHAAICVANLVPIKAIDVLLHAWRQVGLVHPPARLLLVGDGSQRPAMERLAEQLRCRRLVQFLGTRADVPDLLRAADLFVLPSRYEGCSNAVLEAMATGLAVIACRVGGTPELISSGVSGWLVPAEQPEHLARTIVSACLDPTARLRVGQAARHTVVTRFGLQEWLDGYRSLYRELAISRQSFLPTAAEVLACAE